MARQPKMRNIEDTNEALAALGLESPVTTEQEVGLPQEDAGLPQEPVVEEPIADTSVQQEIPLEEKKVLSTQDEDGNITQEEQDRRSWQKSYNEAKAAKEAQEAENLRLRAQVDQIQQSNAQLLNTIAPLMNKYIEPQQPKDDGPPKQDFIEDGMFDPEKFAAYEAKKTAWQTEKLRKDIAADVGQSFEQKTKEQKLQEQLLKVAEVYPEYKNPVTGAVDADKVKRDLEAYTSGVTLIDLMNQARGKVGVVNPLTTPESLVAMKQNAERPSSVVASPESESKVKKVPQKLQEIVELTGGLNLPPDYDGME